MSAQGKSLPFPLQDMRPVPLQISRSRWESEGANYYWMFRNLMNFAIYSPCYAESNISTVSGNIITESRNISTVSGNTSTVSGNTSTISGKSSTVSGKHTEIPVPPGWDLINTVIIPETKDGAEDGFENPDNALPIPFAWVITQGNMMVIFVRSTISEYEWMVDFDYAFTDSDKVDPRLEGMGGIHAGFSKLGLQVFDELQPTLEEQVVEGPIRHVSISAYSRGAGIGTILSYLVQQYINEAVPGLNMIQVDALLFAPPNAGDGVFNKRLSETVNIRAITFEYDVIPQATHDGFPGTTGVSALSRGGTQPGGVSFGPGMMPYQSDNWRCFETLDTRQAFGFLSATHSCSYLCAFSSFVNVTNNHCLLSSEGADLSVASFCTAYPASFPSSPGDAANTGNRGKSKHASAHVAGHRAAPSCLLMNVSHDGFRGSRHRPMQENMGETILDAHDCGSEVREADMLLYMVQNMG
eukprot:gene1390-32759_t